MATCLKLSTSGWSRLESGDTIMSLTQLRKAATRLGVPPSAIVHQADVLADQLEATGTRVLDDKPDELGDWFGGGAGILAVIAGAAVAGAALAASAETPSKPGVVVKPKRRKRTSGGAQVRTARKGRAT